MTVVTIDLYAHVGDFAENKDLAKKIRLESIIPNLEKSSKIIINFENVTAATQSFIHALISDVMRKYGVEVLDRVYFQNCNENVKAVISIVIEYMQDSI